MTGGRRFVDDLPREVIADEAEVSKIANESPAAPPRAKPPSGSNEQPFQGHARPSSRAVDT